MERGQHLVGCSSCSEVIWVGYELADEDEDVVDLILDNPPPPHRKTSMRMHGELLGIEEVIGRGM